MEEDQHFPLTHSSSSSSSPFCHEKAIETASVKVLLRDDDIQPQHSKGQGQTQSQGLGKGLGPPEEEGKTGSSPLSPSLSLSPAHLPLFPYHCQICLEDHLVEDGYELSACHHVFCRDCLVAFLSSKVSEAQVYPKCFYRSHQHFFDPLTTTTSTVGGGGGGNEGIVIPSPSTRLADQDYFPAALTSPMTSHPIPPSSSFSFSSSSSPTTSVAYIQQIGGEHFRVCNQDISRQDIISLLSLSDANANANGSDREGRGESSLVKKYETFKFMRDHKDVRECPFCHHYQITHPHSGPQGNKVICERCQGVYCYRHANAHDFAQENSCEAYEASLADEEKATVQFIQVTTKPCPNCGVRVMKTAGCNHMKCQCGTAFCWLCGKAIDDDIFPAHFQWWNPGRCSNLQMNEAIEPTVWSLAGARCLTLLQLIFLGPLTLISTCTSSLLCGYCFYLRSLDKSTQSCRECLWESFRIQMSFWGIFWMFLLFFFPCFILLGGLMGSTIAIVAMLCYPCYAISRMARGKYPWPDEVTDWVGTCLRGCYRVCLCDCLNRCLGRLLANCRGGWCCCCYCLCPAGSNDVTHPPPPPPPSATTAESSISTIMADESNILRQIIEDHQAIQQARSSSLSSRGGGGGGGGAGGGGDNSVLTSGHRPPPPSEERLVAAGIAEDIEKGIHVSTSSSSFILEVKEDEMVVEEEEAIAPSMSGKWFLDVVNTLVDRLEGGGGGGGEGSDELQSDHALFPHTTMTTTTTTTTATVLGGGEEEV